MRGGFKNVFFKMAFIWAECFLRYCLALLLVVFATIWTFGMIVFFCAKKDDLIQLKLAWISLIQPDIN